jgi:hypothetical protein
MSIKTASLSLLLPVYPLLEGSVLCFFKEASQAAAYKFVPFRRILPEKALQKTGHIVKYMWFGFLIPGVDIAISTKKERSGAVYNGA